MLGGDNSANRVSGSNGNDALDGAGGADSLFGDAAMTLWWVARGPMCWMAARTRATWRPYWNSATGLRAVWLAPAGNSGDAAGDSYVGIEDIGGTGFSDVLGGDNAANQILGGNGNDDIDGFAAMTRSMAARQRPADRQRRGRPADGGAGTYDGASYWNARDCGRTCVYGDEYRHAAGDTYVGIVEPSGSGFNDTLGGDNNANTLRSGWQ